MPFIDTCIFVGAYNLRTNIIKKRKLLLEQAMKAYKQLFTSDFIFLELTSFAFFLNEKKNLLIKLDELIRGTK
jgi:hypothetical protein